MMPKVLSNKERWKYGHCYIFNLLPVHESAKLGERRRAYAMNTLLELHRTFCL